MYKKVAEIQTLLALENDRKIVGAKFLFTEKEYEDCSAREATHQMFFCMMVKAATVGHCLKVKKEHFYCSASSDVLGFSNPDVDERIGKKQHRRNMYATEEIAFDVAQNTPYLDHKVYGMSIQPLEKCAEEPDMILIFCKPYTAMRIIQGYSYHFGQAKNILFAGMSGVCSELMARSYKNQDMNVSFLCSGTRFAAEWRDEEIGIAFPYKMFLKVIQGVKDTFNTFEPDDKKQDALRRAEKNGVSLEVQKGTNYHDSSLGVAKPGVTGYRKKSNRE